MTPAMHVVGALSLAVWAVPVLAVAWIVVRTVLKAPFRSWLPLLVVLGLLLLGQAINALVGPDEMLAIIFLLSGAGR